MWEVQSVSQNQPIPRVWTRYLSPENCPTASFRRACLGGDIFVPIKAPITLFATNCNCLGGWHLSQVQSNCRLIKNLQWPRVKNVSCHQALELGSTARMGHLTPFNPEVETNWKHTRENLWGEVRTTRDQGSLKWWGGRKWSLQKLRGYTCTWASLVAQTVNNLPIMQETRVWSLSGEEPLEEGMAKHSSILAWRTPWTEEPGGLQSMGLQRVGLNWVTNFHLHGKVHEECHRWSGVKSKQVRKRKQSGQGEKDHGCQAAVVWKAASDLHNLLVQFHAQKGLA